MTLLALLSFPMDTLAADISEARASYYRGEYETCIAFTRAEVEKGIWNDVWSRQLIMALLTTGRYQEACQVYEEVSSRYSNSIPLRVLGAEAYRFAGQHERGDKLLSEIPQLIQSAPWRYSDRDNLLAIGRYLLSLGEDARLVLTTFYDRSLKADPKHVEAHLAIAELALDKADYQEAVQSLEKARELRPDDPQIRYLLAKAWQSSDAAAAQEHLQAALELNDRHPESLLFAAGHLVDSENYDEAEAVLDEVFEVNATHPLAWAMKAAIAHLRGNYPQEGQYRKQALSTWQMNPQVDFWIGKELSQHYRFAEGVQYQRRALRIDPEYMPAKFQLAQDLLRIGLDDEGWSIVDQVSAADKYHVVAYNLKSLQSRVLQFTTLDAPGFIIRMDAREARIYGPRVVALLQEAKRVLAAKYEFELTQPVTVEIYPQQSDFAIRTFGLPGGAGFLGVCFGTLITANSPASQGETPSNWESVLWHEFCHVITLQKTNNRMPRWLSEGISVYEEVQRDASWGQSMSPLYQQMLLGDDFVPLSQLSGAFLSPPSPLHLQFAYYEASLAVRYLIETHGLPLLQKLLVDLGAGVPIEEAFANRYGDTEQLDADFERFARELAESFLPDTDFSREGLPRRASVTDLEQWLHEHPASYFAQRQLMEQRLESQQWAQALEAAQGLRAMYPQDVAPGGALETVARVARQLGDSALEREALRELCRYSSDNVPALLRLMEIYQAEEQWRELGAAATQLLAVQPLLPRGHEALVAAATNGAQRGLAESELPTLGRAIDALRALQEMQPHDPAGLHFELAQLLTRAARREAARTEVLLALEYTPRYRAAQKLLVELQRMPASSPGIPLVRPAEGRPPRPLPRGDLPKQ